MFNVSLSRSLERSVREIGKGCRWQKTIYRTIFVVGKSKTTPNQKNHQRKGEIDKLLRANSDKLMAKEEEKYRLRLQELKSLTKSMATIARKQEEEKLKEKVETTPISDIKKESEAVYKSLNILDEKVPPPSSPTAVSIPKNSLIIPSIELPEPISERLGLALRYLVSKDNQNWPMIIDQLRQSGGLKDISQDVARSFIAGIPPHHLRTIIPEIEQLLQEAKLDRTSKITISFMKGISSGNHLTDQDIIILEDYCKYLALRNKGTQSREVYEIMIKAYGKNNNMKKINQALAEMKEHKLEPSPTIFSNILTTCVYKSRDHKQAVEIFDSMKFLSQKTKPGTRAYQDIIVSYVNNDDIERGLDLYQEMISEGIPVNQPIMVALARGCSSRPELKFKSWDFMFEVYNNGWTPSISTYEYMLYLSSKDGDLALSRALYSKLVSTGSETKRSFSFLILAYSKFKGGFEMPLINLHEKGRVFRKNILADIELISSQSEVPFLPVSELTTKQEIMAESSALWAYTIINRPGFINTESATSYLNIASSAGNLTDFIDRLESTTFLDTTGLPGTRNIIIEEPENPTSPTQESYDENSIIKSPLLTQIDHSNRYKVPRSSFTYVIALKAAGKFKNYKFAQRMWSERGQYRKTNNFTNLTRETRDKLDFQFANAMILSLTRMNLLDDALAVLLSTEYQFKWTWKELTHLHKAAVEVGNDEICRTIRGIAKRAQLNFEGKIRRRDYKRYVMERGY